STDNNPIPDFTITDGSDDASIQTGVGTNNIILIAKKATVTGTIRDTNSSGPVIGNVHVTATSAQLSKEVSVDSDPTTGVYSFTGSNSLEPVLWSFNFSKANFNPLGETI